MSCWNNFTPENRINHWKQFREQMSTLSEDEQIQAVATFFADVPLGARCVDYYTPKTWPTPWEILHKGNFCPSSTSLLMYYTFRLLTNFKKDVTIHLIEDNNDRYLIVAVDKIFVLNYELGRISNWHHVKEHEKIIDTFHNEQIPQIT